MPAFNSEDYIQEAIESVLNQDYKNLELIVIDDASTDATKKIIENYVSQDNRIVPVYATQNGGKPSKAKNLGLKKARGEYIAFLDSDDLWLDSKLQKQVELMEKNSKYGLCYTGGYWIDENGDTIKSFLPRYSNGHLLKMMLKKYEINNQSVLIRKEVLSNTIKEFNETITIGEDYNLYMHIISKYEIVAIKEHLIKYRIHKNAITKNKKRVTDGVLVTLKELNLFEKHPLYTMITYLKAIRFKYIKKRWK
jgi:glycosyltransferase involved in cell wall biosynthesis